VISLPYTILVLVPRLEQIDVSLEEAAYDLGASRLRTFRSITLPLILPAVVSAFLIAFTTSFDEYAVASFVVGTGRRSRSTSTRRFASRTSYRRSLLWRWSLSAFP